MKLFSRDTKLGKLFNTFNPFDNPVKIQNPKCIHEITDLSLV